MAREKLGILGRMAVATTAFNVGRSVGKHVEKNGLDFDDGFRSEMREVLGKKEGRLAFAAGIATLGWTLLTRREMALVFLAGLLVGYGVFEKILDRIRARQALPATNGGTTATVDTTAVPT